jgi:hypothetical protein
MGSSGTTNKILPSIWPRSWRFSTRGWAMRFYTIAIPSSQPDSATLSGGTMKWRGTTILSTIQQIFLLLPWARYLGRRLHRSQTMRRTGKNSLKPKSFTLFIATERPVDTPRLPLRHGKLVPGITTMEIPEDSTPVLSASYATVAASSPPVISTPATSTPAEPQASNKKLVAKDSKFVHLYSVFFFCYCS